MLTLILTLIGSFLILTGFISFKAASESESNKNIKDGNPLRIIGVFFFLVGGFILGGAVVHSLFKTFLLSLFGMTY